jgi:peptide/nickel transport system permease protein
VSVLRRLALAVPTLAGITLVTFMLMHLAPGDPAEVRAGQGRGASAETVAALRAEYQLERPLVPRYLAWAGRSLQLDFGRSFVDGRPVRDKIGEALPVTLALALIAAGLAYALAVPLGSLLAVAERRAWVRVLSVALAFAYAVPAAAVGLCLLRLGAPYGGRGWALVAAASCLALATLVRISRYQRAALLEALRADYVRTARAKGGGLATELAHALRNALLPTVTLLGVEVPSLLSGSVIVEQVFGVHGLGLMTFDAVLARDYPVLLGLTTLAALVTLAGVLLADLAYGLIDPRLRGP